MTEPTLPDPEFDRNDPTITDPYTGEVYAFNATGGFTMERGFDTIKLAEQEAPVHVDVTDAIQITMDVATFNAKLDLSSFDTVTDSFGVDEITISSEDLTAGVTSDTQIISVGKYATLYSDFQAYVAAYFGFDGGFSSLFAAASEFAIDENNEFTGESFIALLTASAPHADGRYISELTGSITIANLAKLLKYSVDGNVFGNRDPEVKNWGVSDGFVAGDLIWVPDGTTITLKLAIDAEALNPLNNVGATYGANTAQTQTTTFTSTNFELTTEASTELITRVAKAPLLIKLVTV
jgi:hypothetical protein